MPSTCLSIAAVALTLSQAPATANLDFSAGTLAHWEGSGFRIVPAPRTRLALAHAVSSKDGGDKGQTGMLHRVLQVPKDAVALRCLAYAGGVQGVASDSLDVALMTEGKTLLPKDVKIDSNWAPSLGLFAPKDGLPREYSWSLKELVGKSLRIVIVDHDDRPGRFVYCEGFRLITLSEPNGVPPVKTAPESAGPKKEAADMGRFHSLHFTALSNADDEFTKKHIRDCELFYTLFFEHFRKKGFSIAEPALKLQVNIFDSQAGFEKCLGRKVSPMLTGLYDPRTNSLVTYDYASNELFQSERKKAERRIAAIPSFVDRKNYLEVIARRAHDLRMDTNIGTMMHETAHQIAFNSGILNRTGDVPLWLSEGLACYCEATQDGSWLGIGAMNPSRIALLASSKKAQKPLLPLSDLLANDAWISHKDEQVVLLGYAQSWALFRMLIHEQPNRLKNFCQLVYDRKTRDHRTTDFLEAFGVDVAKLEQKHKKYVADLVLQAGEAKP